MLTWIEYPHVHTIPIGPSTRPPHAPYIWPYLCPPRGSSSNGDHTPFPSYINPSSLLIIIIIITFLQQQISGGSTLKLPSQNYIFLRWPRRHSLPSPLIPLCLPSHYSLTAPLLRLFLSDSPGKLAAAEQWSSFLRLPWTQTTCR